MHISKEKAKARIIAIAGGSGSGKTTLAKTLVQRYGENKAMILSQDTYYFDQSAKYDFDGGSVNFDHPSAIDFPLMAKHIQDLKDGKSIEVPIYDYHTHQRKKETIHLEPKPVVIVDGILVLSQAILRPLFDVKIFIEVSEEVRFERRMRRDTRERGRSVEGVQEQFFRQVKPMHDEFVEPSKQFADVVCNGEDSIPAILRAIDASQQLQNS